jgi:hypothetical protein
MLSIQAIEPAPKNSNGLFFGPAQELKEIGNDSNIWGRTAASTPSSSTTAVNCNISREDTDVQDPWVVEEILASLDMPWKEDSEKVYLKHAKKKLNGS